MSETPEIVKPLSRVEMVLYPLRAPLARGSAAELLRFRHQLAIEARERAREKRALKKLLRFEAKKYGKLIVDCWTRRGEAWIPKRGDPMLLMADVDGKAARRRRKIRRVKFSRVKVSVERIYYQILVSSKTLLGHQNRLPFRVDVADLVNEDAQFELQKQTDRKISFFGDKLTDDPEKGVWVIVDRLEGVGGLPGKVLFRSMTEHYPVDSSVAPILLGVGHPNRTVHMVDLAKCFHVLIAGASGSGKSNILNAILSGWSMNVEPADLRLILIDLKRLEFSFYKKSPHLFIPPPESECPEGVISTVEGAIQVLRYLLKEVHERTWLLEDHARELSAWNQMNPDRKLPRLVCVIDEFSELTLAINRKQREEFRELVIRISQLSRAVGIHLVLCTQRPAVEVVPNAIKINMGLIIGGRTQNRDQSKVIIDGPECSKLPPVPGRMLYRFKPELEEIQTPLCTDDDVRFAVRVAQTRAAGLVTWQGNYLAVERDAMARFIVEKLGGSCTGKALKDAIQAENFVISKKQIEAFIQDMRAVTEIVLAGQRYGVKFKGPQLTFTPVLPADVIEPVDRIWLEVFNPETGEGGGQIYLDVPTNDDQAGNQGDRSATDRAISERDRVRAARRELAELRISRMKGNGNGNHD
ncbi:MAG: DNA translocase FtsK [Anaerolineae bacterium]|nr:DNA translocase FtsK [Anaerolineae bacterium]